MGSFFCLCILNVMMNANIFKLADIEIIITIGITFVQNLAIHLW